MVNMLALSPLVALVFHIYKGCQKTLNVYLDHGSSS